MKTMKIELPDEEADALVRAAADQGFASPADLVRLAIREYLTSPAGLRPEDFESDIDEYLAEKARGGPLLTAEKVRVRLRGGRA